MHSRHCASRIAVHGYGNYPSYGWELEFDTTALGIPFGPGVYDNAQGPSREPDRAGIEISGGLGYIAGATAGSFTVLQADFSNDGSGIVLDLAVDFEQHLDGALPALIGQLRINSDIPITIPRAEHFRARCAGLARRRRVSTRLPRGTASAPTAVLVGSAMALCQKKKKLPPLPCVGLRRQLSC